MASNFHDILGLLAVGVDFHKGLQIFPAPPPVPDFPFWEIVCAHPFFMGPNQQPTVKMNGVPTVVDGHSPLLLWPHFPLAPMNAFWPLDLLFGSQACWLPRGTVFICDQVSTCAVYECVTVTLDCWEPCKIPANLTLQFGTVKTTPSPSDFLFGALRAVIEGAIDHLIDKAFDKLGDKFKKLKDPANDLAVKLTRSGKGYQFAKKLGSKFTSQFSEGLTKRQASGYAKSVGRRITASFLKRAGVGTANAFKTALAATGWEPSRALPKALGNPEEPGSPFKGWPGAGKMANKKVPLYGGVNAVVQAIGG
jgi:hypothetical protein